MFNFLLMIIRIVFVFIPKNKKDIIIENIILKKENEILKRKKKERIKFKFSDRVFYAIYNKFSKIVTKFIILIKPKTVLNWQRTIIKKFWTFPSSKARIGRPSVPNEIKQLILEIKNNNILWGYLRIQGELLKLGIKLDKITIRNILLDFRKRGKIRKGLTWSKFLKSQIKSIYAMDFFTVDTVFNKRFYVLFIIRHKTREIVQFAIISNPVREFVRQQIIDFSENLSEVIYLIHDNAGQFMLNYLDYGIREIKTSVKAPNMNSICERWIASVRSEILDYFIIFNQKQLYNILKEYIENYYNCKRLHQGIEQRIPKGYKVRNTGKVKSRPILFGLNQEYYRQAA